LWKAGLAAVRIGAAGFIVPFMFVYEPALLMEGEWTRILTASVTAGIGCVGLAAGLHGYFVRRSAPWESVAIVAGSILLIDPNVTTDVIGFALLLAVGGYQYTTRTRPTAWAERASAKTNPP